MTSNFIVDMKPETSSKLNYHFLLISLFIIPLCSVIYYCNSSFISILLTSVTLTGITSYIFILICALKRKLKINAVHYILLAILFFSALSTILSKNMYTSLMGQNGRYEGLITIIAYIGLFLSATLIDTKSHIQKICNGFILISIVESILGILQSIPALGDFVPSFYKTFCKNYDAYIANGFTGSPFFLVSMLTLAFGITTALFINSKKLTSKIFYGCSLILYTIASMLTQVTPMYIGIPCVLITMLIVCIIKAPKKLIAFTVATIIVILSAISTISIKGNDINNIRIIMEDQFFRLYISGYNVKINDVNYTEYNDYYKDSFDKSKDLIKENPILGVGPDGILEYKFSGWENAVSNAHSYDNVYNEYLNIAATKGIIGLLAYLILIAYILKLLITTIKTSLKPHSVWLSIGIFSSVIGYLIQAFINMSTITVTPFLWILLGLSVALYNNQKKSE